MNNPEKPELKAARNIYVGELVTIDEDGLVWPVRTLSKMEQVLSGILVGIAFVPMVLALIFWQELLRWIACWLWSMC